MPHYDFSTLNDKEFEVLATDLLSMVVGKRVERFKPGRDKGVDGRFFTDNGGEAIIQCKHYLQTGITQLKNKLIKKSKTDTKSEVEKVQALKPSRYIFVTSLPLTRVNKQELQKIFTPYILSEDDVYGQEDLNSLLGRFTEIEKKHFKLWLSSTNVLQIIMHNAIIGRSQHVLEDRQGKAHLYVATEVHYDAIKKLNELHTVIITGDPGIGKTTLAENLCLFYASEGFTFYSIEGSIKEAEDVFEKEKKQIFYFDDFLGSVYLEAFHGHEDSHIVRFIKRIRKDPTKRFILTSRTNIINQGKALSDTFKSEKIEQNEHLLSVSKLNDIDKARIFYNHLFFSNLAEEYIEEIYLDKRYLQVINHRNYNSRLIEYITDRDRLIHISADEYWAYTFNTLENPADIWSTAYTYQIDDYMRNIIRLVVFNNGKIDEITLKQAYYDLNIRLNLQNNSPSSKSFETIIKVLVGSFLNRSWNVMDSTIYTLFNPSISDYIYRVYKDEMTLLIHFGFCLRTEASLGVLSSLRQNALIKESTYFKVIKELFNEAKEKVIDTYLVQLAFLLFTDHLLLGQETKIITVLQDRVNCSIDIPYSFQLIELILYYLEEKQLAISNPLFIAEIIENSDADLDDINYILKLQQYIPLDAKSTANLTTLIDEYIDAQFHSLKYSIKVDLVSGGYEWGGYEFDEEAMMAQLQDIIADICSEFSANIGDYFDPSSLLSRVDLSDLGSDIISHGDDYDPDDRYRPDIGVSSIEDLFERS